MVPPRDKSSPRPSAPSRTRWAWIALSLSGVLLVGCGSDPGEEAPGGEAPGSGDISLDSASNGSGTGQPGGDTSNGGCLGLEVAEGCGGEVFEGESVPLDLYLMFDQSGSMATVVDEDTGALRIDVVRAAVRAFLDDEESAGIGVGIGTFGDQPLGETSCDPDAFSEPDVEIEALPGQAATLNQSLDEKVPTGETPTGAAIRGACAYVAHYRKAHPGRAPSIVLVTDGEPKAPLSQQSCAPTLDDAVLAAEDCLEEAGIRTYVLGVGPSLTNLRVIAEAGGTKQAYLADLDNTDQVLGALRAVRGSAQLPCDLHLASEDIGSDGIEFGSSTVAYLDADCAYVAVPERKDPSGCEDDQPGFYFDDPHAPTRITLCESTCGDVKADGRQLFYSLGCPLTVVR